VSTCVDLTDDSQAAPRTAGVLRAP